MPGHHPRLRVRRSWLWPAITGALVIVFVSAGAAAALETDTVTSYWRGVWWSISLITTVGFIGAPPRTDAGAALSVVLMVIGFMLLALVSASLAALFVHDDERPSQAHEELTEDAVLVALTRVEQRLSSIESRLAEDPESPAEPVPEPPHGGRRHGPEGT